MAKLPKEEMERSPTAKAIDELYERDQWIGTNDRLTASTCAEACDRQIWLVWRWAYQPKPKEGRMLRLFETGHREEARVVDLLRKAGVDISDRDPDTNKQWTVKALDGHFIAKLDGLAQGVIEAPKAMHVLEVKTSNTKTFNAIRSKGVEKGKPEHWVQMQLEMHLTGIERSLYVVKNKEDDDIEIQRISYDADACMRILARLERILASASPPARISEDPDHFGCRFCPALDPCQRMGYTPRSCRTCIHSSPVPGGDASWRCTLHGIDLDRDTQKAGCDQHLYIPGLIPGEVVDADETPGHESITYRFADGTTWTDTVDGELA